MLSRPLFRFVREDKHIPFMRGRFAGLATSAILSALSVVLFFVPGLKLGLDFHGGIVVEAQTQGPADFDKLRHALAAHQVTAAGLQKFGADNDVLIQLDTPPPGPKQEPPHRHWSMRCVMPWLKRSRARRCCAQML